MKEIVVAIDAGHGMDNKKPGVYDPGVVYAGIEEANVTLAYALTLKYVLNMNGIACLLTRKSEEDSASLGARVERAIGWEATHLLSFHVNAADNHSARGVETFYPAGDRGNEHGPHFARRVAAWSAKALGRPNRGAKPETDAARGRLALAAFPGHFCLLEVGFVTNPYDRARLLLRESRLAVAEGIVRALRGEEPSEE